MRVLGEYDDKKLSLVFEKKGGSELEKGPGNYD